MPYVNYLEFNVADAERSRDFYATVFGWDPQPFAEGYFVASHGDEPGIDTGIQSQDTEPAAVPVISVPSIDDAITAVAEAGGTVIVDKFEIPQVGFAAYFIDPAGIQMGLHQPPVA